MCYEKLWLLHTQIFSESSARSAMTAPDVYKRQLEANACRIAAEKILEILEQPEPQKEKEKERGKGKSKEAPLPAESPVENTEDSKQDIPTES